MIILEYSKGNILKLILFPGNSKLRCF